ncbi:uncharacterized protein LOC119631922 [Glossina fuscipes]|uniref:Uncharacterized protein LOC119631922 n=1 Tax=Glossina fuscipes TaxID=7396 RepID=A0A8U0W5F4_9MUSC|nr:uncharacterized protein LOC119631922 [Glossina fuscipes]KAI9588036.1 hypothetical protein GQX74_003882 [Glossina fuscipes]
MAKKGGVQQLQVDIQNDDDFEKFLERPGLLVLDVYSDWCGPCLGMLGSLKKIKLEVGGDNLHLAICKSDGITALRRFLRKSEPTWLFVTGGKAVNIYFGTSVPVLMKLITNELKQLGNTARPMYDVTELQPIEVKRWKIKEDAIAEADAKEKADKEKKRVNYLMYVTDTIMDALPDMGVTLFGPQVNRDMFKKLQEPADALKIQCKDRKMAVLTKEQFDIINFQSLNPLTPDVIEQLHGKECLCCFWKIPDEGNNIAVFLNKYAQELTTTKYVPADDFHEEQEIPPILTPMDIKVEIEVGDDEEWIEEPEPETAAQREAREEAEAAEEEEFEDEEEEAATAAAGPPEPPPMDMPPMDLGLDTVEEPEQEEEEKRVEEAPKKRTRKITIQVPPIWVPNDHRTHAALIYVFFRPATTAFLPPDPKPEPPHIIMAFDAYKKKDLIAHAERNKIDVPLYGFFTSDDPDEAKFIASSDIKYSQKEHRPADKLIFKVNKATSNTMLSLVTYGPSYVSPNTVIGRDEAKKFFPESYKTYEQEMAEQTQEEIEENRRTQSKTKSKIGFAPSLVPKAQEPTEMTTEAEIPEDQPVASAEGDVSEMQPEAAEMSAEAPTETEAPAG